MYKPGRIMFCFKMTLYNKFPAPLKWLLAETVLTKGPTESDELSELEFFKIVHEIRDTVSLILQFQWCKNCKLSRLESPSHLVHLYSLNKGGPFHIKFMCQVHLISFW